MQSDNENVTYNNIVKHYVYYGLHCTVWCGLHGEEIIKSMAAAAMTQLHVRAAHGAIGVPESVFVNAHLRFPVSCEV